ncbi:MAG: MarR family transcriptional regulator [Clostridiales Family XIII bacterium]|jgi:DNA-binding MarR family transcriptional regulator|nr:MarR family transcriptional regulator [Clostridiales Family XIII bacterium]
MNEIKTTIAEQLRQLQMLMHRASFHPFMAGGRAHNPHRGQGRVLAILKLKPEISQRELTYLLGMSRQSIAELLAKLERSGYITREPSEEDRRVVTVRLTEAGKSAADGAEEEAPETEKILGCLNDDELAAFSGYLGRIIQRYEEQFPEEDFEQRRKMMEEFMAQHGHGFGGHGRPHGRGCGGGHGRPRRHGSGDHERFPGHPHDRPMHHGFPGQRCRGGADHS